MHRHLAVLLLGAAIAASGTYAALSQTGPAAADDRQSQSFPVQQVSDKALTVERIDRDGIRVLSFEYTGSSVTEVHSIQAEDEINVSSLTIENGLFGSTPSNSGGVTLTVGSVDYFFSFSGHGTTNYTFSTPIPLRERDEVGITISLGNGGAVGYTQVNLTGRHPVTSNRMMVF